MLGIAKLVLTEDEYKRLCKIPSANSIGKMASTVGDMCDKQQRVLGRLAPLVDEAVAARPTSLQKLRQ